MYQELSINNYNLQRFRQAHKLLDESNNDTCLVSEQKSITCINLKSFNIMSPNNKSNQ